MTEISVFQGRKAGLAATTFAQGVRMKMLRVLLCPVLLLVPTLASTASSSRPTHQHRPDFSKPHIPGELIIGLVPTAEDEAEALLADQSLDIAQRFRSANNMQVRLLTDEPLATVANRLLQDPRVRFVEPNYIIQADRTPNDPRYGELYGLHNSGQQAGLVDADIDAPEAWDQTVGTHKVLVGVIDTGIDYTHPDLAANYWYNPGETGFDAQGNDKSTNGIDDDNNGYIDDFRGWDFAGNDNDPIDDNGYSHGSHCAGTIGAVGDNGVGITGINWNVSMVGIKFLDAGGFGSLAGAIGSIEYATLIGVDLTSNSWGGGGYSQAMADAITAAQAAGILFVAAAGNDGADNDGMAHYPSSYEHDIIISVAATDRNDQLASFSNWGRYSVDIAAPGVDILSTQKNNTYGTLSGTSMATPHVAGAAALIWSRFPELTAAEVKSRILMSGDDNAATKGKSQSGKRLNLNLSVENDNIAPSAPANLVTVDAGRRHILAQWQAAGDDGEAGRASAYEVRWSASPMDSEEEWAAAKTPSATIDSVSSEGIMTATVGNLSYNSNGYLAVRAVDNVGNRGPISESIPFAVQSVEMIYGNTAESMEGLVAEGTWGLEAVPERQGLVFSDSPAGKYLPRANQALTLPAFPVRGSNLTLTFMTKTDIERGYDFGIVEVMTDRSATWTEIAKLTDRRSWNEVAVSLQDLTADAEWVQLRFRLTSDGDIEYEGWWIDDVAVIVDAE